MIKISVIIPCYNEEKYIRDCLDSVVMQTLSDIEILCIDDGSTDHTLSILREYEKRYSSIRVITQQNCGVAITRNCGMEEAVGEYIAFMDADDYYPDKNVLEEVYQAAVNNNALICGGGLWEDHSTFVRTKYEGIYQKFLFSQDGWVYFKDYQFDYGYYRFIFKKDFLLQKKIFFPDYERFQDPPFLISAMLHAEKFYGMKRITYVFRVGSHDIKWTEKKVKALLKGLIDDLEMSRQSQLDELHKVTVWRLLEEFNCQIADNITDISFEVSDLLMKAQSLIKEDLFIHDKIQKHGVGGLYLKTCEILSYQQSVLSKELQELTNRNHELEHYIYELEQNNHELMQNYEQIVKSKSYRFGNLLLRFPILIRRYFIEIEKRRKNV